MSEVRPIQIAVIGAAGLIGVRHVQNVLEEAATTLSAIVDPSPTGQALLEARRNGKVIIDAAIAATPNHTHVPIGIQLIDNDVTTLVEKPIAVQSSAVSGLLQAVERAKTRGSSAAVSVGHHRRFNTYIHAAKRALSSRVLGKIIAFQGTWAVLKDLDYFKAEWRTKSGSGGPI